MLAEARADGVPLVVDADALALVDGPVGVPAVLTPHAGELARMTGADRADIEAAPLRHAREAARTYDAVVLLKGRHTVVARPDGRARVTTTGVPWLATAGAGDVLAGLIGALLAAGLEPFDAASVGSWLHGAAATYASQGGPLTAPDVARAIPAVVRDLALKHLCPCARRSWSTWRRSGTTPGRWPTSSPPRALMTVVKADGYGHGIVESGRAARARRSRAGSASPPSPEALALRDAGDTGRLLCWLTLPADVEDGSLARAVDADVDITAYTVERLDEIVAAGSGGARPRVQLKVDTGLSRGGATLDDWPDLVAARGRARARRPGSGHRRLVALRLQRRAGAPRQRPPGAALPRGSRGSPRRPACDPRYATSPTPPPRSCGPAAGFDLVRCGHGDLRPRPRSRRRRPTSACGPR